ncbi:MAG: CD3072 family TudS-related putative desulfidase [Negativibacillus sp.]
MEQQKIVFVSHCALNTAAKVQRSAQEGEQEEKLRRGFLHRVVDQGIQLIQLPCPEFTLYGASRWGHVKEQFDNPFFRDHCRKILQPIIQQMKGYLQPREQEKFRVLGVVGINGSPSCGVKFTCSAPWGGEFSSHDDLPQLLRDVRCVPERGVLMEVLSQMMQEEGIDLPMVGLDAEDPQPLYELLEGKNRK